MSGALSPQTDSSIQTGLTLQDLSLGSLPSFSTPAKYRVPSTASGTTALSSTALTPSPGSSLLRKKTEESVSSVGKRLAFSKQSNDGDDDDADVDILDTPNRDGKVDGIETPAPNRTKRKSAPGTKGTSNLTLRDQEKVSSCLHILSDSISDIPSSISIR